MPLVVVKNEKKLAQISLHLALDPMAECFALSQRRKGLQETQAVNNTQSLKNSIFFTF